MAFVLLFLKCYYFFSGNCDFNAVSELRSLKSRLEELESDLRDRDEQIGTLKEQNKSVNGDDSDVVKVSIMIYFEYHSNYTNLSLTKLNFSKCCTHFSYR